MKFICEVCKKKYHFNGNKKKGICAFCYCKLILIKDYPKKKPPQEPDRLLNDGFYRLNQNNRFNAKRP